MQEWHLNNSSTPEFPIHISERLIFCCCRNAGELLLYWPEKALVIDPNFHASIISIFSLIMPDNYSRNIKLFVEWTQQTLVLVISIESLNALWGWEWPSRATTPFLVHSDMSLSLPDNDALANNKCTETAFYENTVRFRSIGVKVL